MQNLDVGNIAIKITKRNKDEIKKDLKVSIINIEKHENKEIEERGKIVQKSEDAAEVILEFEEIIRSKKKNIGWMPHHQGKIVQKY